MIPYRQFTWQELRHANHVKDVRRVLEHRRTYRGSDECIARIHPPLCNWADEVRDARQTMVGVLGTLATRTGGGTLHISDLSGAIDELVNHADRDTGICLHGYYRWGWPLEAIGRNLAIRLKVRATEQRLDEARLWAYRKLLAAGWSL